MTMEETIGKSSTPAFTSPLFFYLKEKEEWELFFHNSNQFV